MEESGKKQSNIKKKKSSMRISVTPTSPRVKMFADEYMRSGMSEEEALEKARQYVSQEKRDLMAKYNEERNNTGCLLAILIIISPTILFSLLIF